MKTTAALAIGLLTFTASLAQADTFGSGANQFDIEFVSIGNPGNTADTTGDPSPPHLTGKVDYAYRMGKYAISRDMITKANAEGGLGITLSDMSIFNGGPRDDMPATGVSWLEAAQFVNWLNDEKGASPAYKFNGSTFELWQPGDAGYNPNNLFRNSQAFYFLPSVDEWYKAAYYDPSANGGSGGYWNYPTGSDSAPASVASGTAAGTAVYNRGLLPGPADITLAGGLSPYGTMGQGGNVWEWEETEFDLVNNSSSSGRVFRGGVWGSESGFLRSSNRGLGGAPGAPPAFEDRSIGFRVASIPEPSTMLMGALAAVGLLVWRRR